MNCFKKIKYSETDMLVALLKEPRDLIILKELGWYRIPVKNAPKNMDKFQYIAFYQPDCFKEHSRLINYYGEVYSMGKRKRVELLPKETEHSRANDLYYRIVVKNLKKLSDPIVSSKPRRIVFIPTCYSKFELANNINDLFHGSPLEDRIWKKLQEEKIPAERQYDIKISGKAYKLDFAVFCKKGNVNIECDGDTYHISKEKSVKDNERNNLLTQIGWSILRFNTKQILNDKLSIMDNIKKR